MARHASGNRPEPPNKLDPGLAGLRDLAPAFGARQIGGLQSCKLSSAELGLAGSPRSSRSPKCSSLHTNCSWTRYAADRSCDIRRASPNHSRTHGFSNRPMRRRASATLASLFFPLRSLLLSVTRLVALWPAIAFDQQAAKKSWLSNYCPGGGVPSG